MRWFLRHHCCRARINPPFQRLNLPETKKLNMNFVIDWRRANRRHAGRWIDHCWRHPGHGGRRRMQHLLEHFLIFSDCSLCIRRLISISNATVFSEFNLQRELPWRGRIVSHSQHCVQQVFDELNDENRRFPWLSLRPETRLVRKQRGRERYPVDRSWRRCGLRSLLKQRQVVSIETGTRHWLAI